MARKTYNAGVPVEDPTKMNKRELVAYYKDQIRLAQAMRRDDEGKWLELVSMWNIESDDEITNDEIECHNTHYGHQIIAKLLSMLVYRDPKWDVVADTGQEEDRNTATLASGWLSDFVYRNQVRADVLEENTLDLILTGRGYCELGFNVDDAVVANKKEATSEGELMKAEAAAMLADQGYSQTDIDAIIDEVTKEVAPPPPMVLDDDLFSDEPFVKYADAFDCYLAPGYKSLKAAWEGGGWFAKRDVVPLRVAKKNPRFLAKDKMSATSEIDSPYWQMMKQFETKSADALCEDVQYIELFYVWQAPDKIKGLPGRVLVISEGSDLPHYDGDNPYPELDAFPFESVCIKRKKHSFLGIPLLRHYQADLRQYDRLRSVSLDIAKSQKPLLMAVAGIWDDNNIANLAEASAGSIHKVQSVDGLKALDILRGSPDLQAEISRLQSDIFFKAGLGPNQMGALSPAGRPATEISIVQQNSGNDIASMNEIISQYWVRIGRKLLKLLKAKTPPEKVLRAVGRPGKTWKSFSADEIDDEVDVRIGAGSAKPVDEAVYRKQLLDLAIGLGNSFPADINQKALLREVFERMDLPNPDDYIVPDDDDRQLLENIIMLRGGEVPAEPTDNHARHIADLDKTMRIMGQDLQASAQQGDEMAAMGLQLMINHRQQHQDFLANQPGAQAQMGQVTAGDTMAATRGAQ